MLSNVADLTAVIADMARDGHSVIPELVASTSPYMREQIRRFGRFTLDMQDLPDPSIRNHFRSRQPCDHFLHVSRTYTIVVGTGAGMVGASRATGLFPKMTF